jgi:seryl-tRNA synthetase
MGKPDYRQIDIESWMPSQGIYRETQTSDYMTDFQSRRLNTAYKAEDGQRKYLYMNDATAIAIGRTLVAIMENNQQEDGSIVIPKVLKKYIGMDKIQSKA